MLGFGQRNKARKAVLNRQRELTLARPTAEGIFWNGRQRAKGDKELNITIRVEQGVPVDAYLKETQFVLAVPSMGVEPRIITRGTVDAQAIWDILPIYPNIDSHG